MYRRPFLFLSNLLSLTPSNQLMTRQPNSSNALGLLEIFLGRGVKARPLDLYHRDEFAYRGQISLLASFLGPPRNGRDSHLVLKLGLMDFELLVIIPRGVRARETIGPTPTLKKILQTNGVPH